MLPYVNMYSIYRKKGFTLLESVIALGLAMSALAAIMLSYNHVDILPALLSRRERPWAIGPLLGGDSYGVLQSIHLEESLRWVPASSEMHALPLRDWHG